MEKVDVAVIGAGHAGMGISYHLAQRGIQHIVFERGQIAETWRSQRWDTFVMNTPNKYNIIHAGSENGLHPDGFGTAKEFADYLSGCCSKYSLPVKEHAKVTSVRPGGNGAFFISVHENGTTKHYESRQVIVASGCMNQKKIPDFAHHINPGILQLHTCDYRSAAQLPVGGVLVTGSAQSGCQVAEDLADAGRTVYLSTSKVGRFRRRYRGKDIVDWLLQTGFFDMKTEDVTDPALLTTKVPVVSGIGPLGHTLSYQLLAKRGVTILGRTLDADSESIILASDAAENIRFGDEFSQRVNAMVDEYIARQKLDAPTPEPDTADKPDVDASCACRDTRFHLRNHNVTSIIWTTGFLGDFSFLPSECLGMDGLPKHTRGISEIKGIYFLGLPWLRTRKSANLIGINDDVQFISNTVAATIGKA